MSLPRLPLDAMADLRAAKFKNQMVLQRVLEQEPGGCGNCGGQGTLWLQFVTGGPFQFPPGGKEVMVFHGRGWYKVESKTYACPVCRDPEERRRYLWSLSGLELAEQAWRVDYLEGLDGKEQALETARAILAQAPRPVGWTLFHGVYGVGKTGLLKSLVAQTILTGGAARWVRAIDILSELKATYGDNSQVTEQQVVEQYGKFQLLAVDEVDRISDTAWAKAALMMILDTRYSRRVTCATALATNCHPEEMPEGFEYLESRMRDGKRVRVGGMELRGRQ